MAAQQNNRGARRRKRRKTQLKRLEKILGSEDKLFASLTGLFYSEVDINEALEQAAEQIKTDKTVRKGLNSELAPNFKSEVDVLEHKVPILPLSKSEVESAIGLLRIALTEHRPELLEMLAREMRRRANEATVKEIDTPLRELLLAARNGPVDVKLLARQLMSNKESEKQKDAAGKIPPDKMGNRTKAETARLRAYERQLERCCLRFKIPRIKRQPRTLRDK